MSGDEFVDVAEGYLPRKAGPESPGGDYTIGDVLAFVVPDVETGEEVFDLESAPESAVSFFRSTSFSTHAIVQIEPVVPDRSHETTYSDLSISDGRGVIRYEVRETNESAHSSPVFSEILLRVNVEDGGIREFVVARGDNTSEVIGASELKNL